MDIQAEQDIDSDTGALPPTYPTIYLDDVWNVVGFNEVATRLFLQSGDSRWFEPNETFHVFDILCSDHGKAMLSRGHEDSLNRTVLCFRALTIDSFENNSLLKEEYAAVWNRLTETYPLIKELRFAEVSDGAVTRVYKDISGNLPASACHITASLDVMEAKQIKLQFVCEIARNDSNLENPTAYQVCLIPENSDTDMAVILLQIDESDLPKSSFQGISNPDTVAAVTLEALSKVVSGGLRDSKALERHRPEKQLRDEICKLSQDQPSWSNLILDLALRNSDVETVIYSFLPTEWQM